MVNELLVRYREDINENKIMTEIYQILKNNGIEPRKVIFDYNSKIKIFDASYQFHEKDNPSLSVLEGILNEVDLLKKVAIMNLK